MSRVSIPWGRGETLSLDLPAAWKIAGVLEPAPAPPEPDPAAAVREALASPIGSPRLKDLAAGARRAVILIDDLSRPTPAHLLLPHVLQELALPLESVTLVTALGTHRPMTREEVATKAGGIDLPWQNHDYADSAKNVHLGVTSRGTPVDINATVAAADIVVSLGVIEPHVIAGFGGGYKNLVPGAAGAKTIAATHTLNLTPATFNMTGRPADENPMRLDLEEAGALLRKPFFIVNTVLDASLRIVRVVAGHPVAAHREGAKTAAGLYGVEIPRPADVVITASCPMDTDLRQGLKALANNLRAVRPGGVLIGFIRAEEGIGHIQPARNPGRRVLKLLAPLLLQLLPRRHTASQGEEFKFFTYFGLQALRRNRLLLYAPSIPKPFARSVPFAEFAWTLEDLWATSPKKAEVLIVPNGGVTYPILRSDS